MSAQAPLPLRFLLFLCASMLSAPTFAHGLLMKLDASGQTISGEVYFSNGQRAEGVWVELFSQGKTNSALQTIQTDRNGKFSFNGKTGDSYQVRASGEEGHEIVLEITVSEDHATGAMVEQELQQDKAWFQIPAWAALGGFLLLSLVPAYWLRTRAKSDEKSDYPQDVSSDDVRAE